MALLYTNYHNFLNCNTCTIIFVNYVRQCLTNVFCSAIITDNCDRGAFCNQYPRHSGSQAAAAKGADAEVSANRVRPMLVVRINSRMTVAVRRRAI